MYPWVRNTRRWNCPIDKTYSPPSRHYWLVIHNRQRNVHDQRVRVRYSRHRECIHRAVFQRDTCSRLSKTETVMMISSIFVFLYLWSCCMYHNTDRVWLGSIDNGYRDLELVSLGMYARFQSRSMHKIMNRSCTCKLRRSLLDSW